MHEYLTVYALIKMAHENAKQARRFVKSPLLDSANEELDAAVLSIETGGCLETLVKIG
jgi:hypothetical protein